MVPPSRKAALSFLTLPFFFSFFSFFRLLLCYWNRRKQERSNVTLVSSSLISRAVTSYFVRTPFSMFCYLCLFLYRLVFTEKFQSLYSIWTFFNMYCFLFHCISFYLTYYVLFFFFPFFLSLSLSLSRFSFCSSFRSRCLFWWSFSTACEAASGSRSSVAFSFYSRRSFLSLFVSTSISRRRSTPSLSWGTKRCPTQSSGNTSIEKNTVGKRGSTDGCRREKGSQTSIELW